MGAFRCLFCRLPRCLPPPFCSLLYRSSTPPAHHTNVLSAAPHTTHKRGTASLSLGLLSMCEGTGNPKNVRVCRSLLLPIPSGDLHNGFGAYLPFYPLSERWPNHFYLGPHISMFPAPTLSRSHPESAAIRCSLFTRSFISCYFSNGVSATVVIFFSIKGTFLRSSSSSAHFVPWLITSLCLLKIVSSGNRGPLVRLIGFVSVIPTQLSMVDDPSLSLDHLHLPTRLHSHLFLLPLPCKQTLVTPK